MTVLEAARRLRPGLTCAENCFECDASITVGELHAPDCPWLALPKIVAALEAAERSVRALDENPRMAWDHPVMAAVDQLGEALKGEGA